MRHLKRRLWFEQRKHLIHCTKFNVNTFFFLWTLNQPVYIGISIVLQLILQKSESYTNHSDWLAEQMYDVSVLLSDYTTGSVWWCFNLQRIKAHLLLQQRNWLMVRRTIIAAFHKSFQEAHHNSNSYSNQSFAVVTSGSSRQKVWEFGDKVSFAFRLFLKVILVERIYISNQVFEDSNFLIFK